MADFFWFTDEQWSRIEPLLPRDARGMPRVDDRRVLGDCPCPEDWRSVGRHYGPKKTLYNRFRRWAERAGLSAVC